MSEAKHTSGPWAAILNIWDEFEIATVNDDVLIAQIESESDAALIATAPEMFDVIQELLAEVQVWENEHGTHPAAVKAREIIAKAKGESK